MLQFTGMLRLPHLRRRQCALLRCDRARSAILAEASCGCFELPCLLSLCSVPTLDRLCRLLAGLKLASDENYWAKLASSIVPRDIQFALVPTIVDAGDGFVVFADVGEAVKPERFFWHHAVQVRPLLQLCAMRQLVLFLRCVRSYSTRYRHCTTVASRIATSDQITSCLSSPPWALPTNSS